MGVCVEPGTPRALLPAASISTRRGLDARETPRIRPQPPGAETECRKTCRLGAGRGLDDLATRTARRPSRAERRGASTRSQPTQIIRHVSEFLDHLGIAEIAGGWVASPAECNGAQVSLGLLLWPRPRAGSNIRSVRQPRCPHRWRRRYWPFSIPPFGGTGPFRILGVAPF